MSYFSPVYINQHVSNPIIVGLILASSSVVGYLCDLVFGEIFRDKKYGFFLFWGIVIGSIFPLIFLGLPNLIIFYILAMAAWGIYFELLKFSDFNFINHATAHEHHSRSWGILLTFIAAAYMIAPIIASATLEVSAQTTLVTALTFYLISGIIFIYFTKNSKASNHHAITNHRTSLRFELSLWRLLGKSLWPVLMFINILYILDAVFWTSGAILSEQIKSDGIYGGLLYLVYLGPMIVLGILAPRISKPFGKKKAAFTAGIFAGIFFLTTGLIDSSALFIVFTFFGSIFLAIATPQINGAIEDYLERLGGNANSLIGLENSMVNLAYIIGPIAGGVIASVFDYKASFAIIGGILIVISTVALIKSPRKIKLPQSQIKLLETTQEKNPKLG
jgi:diacylglycerol kinase